MFHNVRYGGRLEAENELRENPTNNGARVYLADLLQKKGKYERAVKLLREALKNDRENFEALMALAHTYMLCSREDQAIGIYDTALDFSGLYDGFRDDKISVGTEFCITLRSLHCFRSNLSQYPRMNEVRLLSAILHRKRGEMDTARGYLLEITRSMEDGGSKMHVEVLYEIGSIEEVSNNQEEAIKKWEEGISIDSKHTRTLKSLSYALYWSGRKQRAKTLLTKLINSDEAGGMELHLYAEVCMGENNYLEAMEYYELSTKKKSPNADTWIQWSYCFLRDGKEGRAREILEKGIIENHKDAVAQKKLEVFQECNLEDLTKMMEVHNLGK